MLLKQDQSEHRIQKKSRGWTPLRYPKSAIFSTGTTTEEFSFPFHNDVLLAAIRELLILDGVLEAKTLQISHETVSRCQDSDSLRVPGRVLYNEFLSSLWCFKGGLMQGSTRSPENACIHRHSSAGGTSRNGAETDGSDYLQSRLQSPSAEAIAHFILEKSRVVDTAGVADEAPETVSQGVDRKGSNKLGTDVVRRPRTVSEADQSSNSLPPSSPPGHCSADYSDDAAGNLESTDISQILNLKQQNRYGSFDPLAQIDRHRYLPELIHVSIVDEEILREAATKRTQKFVKMFSDDAVRAFFGYKISGIDHERLVLLLADLLFDVSHALYAWEQTENEILSARSSTVTAENVDDLVLKSLFGGSEHVLKRVGGFDTSSILPNAISIGRLRRRNITWTYSASTRPGRRLLEHHKCEKSRILVGKLRRRGHRQRQRRHVTSSSESSSVICASVDEIKDVVIFDASRIKGIHAQSKYSHLLQRWPGCMALTIARPDGGTSWGVTLVKEVDGCVVGRVLNESSLASIDNADDHLVCGDLILLAQNEDGECACSPLCAHLPCAPTDGVNAEFRKHDDWYLSLVNLFKNSQELQLVVLRVT
jgi:hypothetical protein